MARFEFRLPDIGEGIAEAELVGWLVKAGDTIAEDQPIAELMTDKATVEMETPVSGVVLELGGRVGEMVAIGSTLIVVETVDEATQLADIASSKVMAGVSGSEAPSSAAGAVEIAPQATGEIAMAPAAATPAMPDHRAPRIAATPAVRARARDLAIDLASVRPSEDGRIRHGDLDAYLTYNTAQGYGRPSPVRPDETIKVVGLRRRIAENMAASKRNIPHFSYVDEVEVTKLEEVRSDLNDSRGDRPRLTVLPLIIVALCKALPSFPMLNARYDDEAGVVTRHGAVHLGIATQTDAGLMVPVLRDAQAKNVWQLAAEIDRLAKAARSGKARSEELSGSTLTITSLGPLGGIATTPVINRPEVAIVGPNKIVERPVFDGDKIRRAKLMNVSISCDHRVVDGWDAANFVQDVKRRLEAPVHLFAD